MKRLLKRERGASAILEAALIYPMVIIIIAAMVYMALYLLQTSMLYTRAYQVANIASRCMGMPGYEKLGPNLEGNDYSVVPDEKAIEAAIEDYSLLKDAYRYWNFGKEQLQSDVKNRLAEEYCSMVASSGFLGGEVNCEIRSSNNGITQYVTVNITGAPEYPAFLDYIGMSDTFHYNISVRAVATDNSEFIRNADIALDFTQFLLEKLHLDDKFSEYFSRIKSFVSGLKK